MGSKKLKNEKGITIKVHPSFKSDVLGRMDREVEMKLGLINGDSALDDVQKTKILARNMNDQRFKFFMTEEERIDLEKKRRRR